MKVALARSAVNAKRQRRMAATFGIKLWVSTGSTQPLTQLVKALCLGA